MEKKIALIAGASLAAAAASISARQQGKAEAMLAADSGGDEGLPDRLSIERGSRYYTNVGEYVGVKLDGEDVNGRVIEFCRSGGWVRLVDASLAGQRISALAAQNAIRHKGVVETYWRMKPSRQVRRQLERIG